MAHPHLSIGEVLNLLQPEFPDITISKIRFLESQGLIDPERTPSGYRKFYDGDIERLRWILIQQRENFLPLKVIKDRLAEGAATASRSEPETTPEADPVDDGTGTDTARRIDTVEDEALPSAPTDGTAEGSGRAEPIWMADVAKANRANKNRPSRSGLLDSADSEVSLNGRELEAAAGLSAEALAELVQYGLIAGRNLGDDTYYDGDALIIARRAASFLAHGIEARHLRMYKVSAEREAGFLEQVAMPLLKQRNPQARQQAIDLVTELTELGDDLRGALLRANLRRHLDRG